MTDLMRERTAETRAGSTLRCNAMTAPAPGLRTDQLAEWMFLTAKCMQPATAVVRFWCGNGHGDTHATCDAHLADGGQQLCGYCADTGVAAEVTVRLVSRF